MPFAEYYIFAALAAVPAARIFRRAGFKPYWALLLAVPDIGMVLCAGVLALRTWPKEA